MLTPRVLRAKAAEAQGVFKTARGFKPKRRGTFGRPVLQAPLPAPFYRLSFDGQVATTHRKMANTFLANLKRHKAGRYVWCPFARAAIVAAVVEAEGE